MKPPSPGLTIFLSLITSPSNIGTKARASAYFSSASAISSLVIIGSRTLSFGHDFQIRLPWAQLLTGLDVAGSDQNIGCLDLGNDLRRRCCGLLANHALGQHGSHNGGTDRTGQHHYAHLTHQQILTGGAHAKSRSTRSLTDHLSDGMAKYWLMLCIMLETRSCEASSPTMFGEKQRSHRPQASLRFCLGHRRHRRLPTNLVDDRDCLR